MSLAKWSNNICIQARLHCLITAVNPTDLFSFHPKIRSCVTRQYQIRLFPNESFLGLPVYNQGWRTKYGHIKGILEFSRETEKIGYSTNLLWLTENPFSIFQITEQMLDRVGNQKSRKKPPESQPLKRNWVFVLPFPPC